MPYCEACGAQVNPTAKFCGACGAQRTPPTQTQPAATPKPAQEKQRIEYYSSPNMAYVPSAPLPIMTQQPQIQPPFNQAPLIVKPPPVQTQAVSQTYMPQQTGEATVGVILFRHPKSLGRYDSYVGVVTTERLLFAQLTSEMLNQAAQQARDQAKAQGKGFFGAWGDQIRATMGYINRYMSIPPQAILSETQGNFAIYNSTISEVKIHLKGQDENDGPREFEAEIKSSGGTYKYRLNEDSQSTDLLKRVYGDRVKMPFGYFNKAVNIKF
jgi:hypothetical protein